MADGLRRKSRVAKLGGACDNSRQKRRQKGKILSQSGGGHVYLSLLPRYFVSEFRCKPVTPERMLIEDRHALAVRTLKILRSFSLRYETP
jgi:hypothetical protein